MFGRRSMVVLLLSLCACGGSQQPPPSPPIANHAPASSSPPPAPPQPGSPWQGITAKFGDFTHQMCACRDSACAQKVSDDMVKWASELARQNERTRAETPEQQKQLAALAEEMTKCMSAAMTAPTP
jgi:hypothetical protein